MPSVQLTPELLRDKSAEIMDAHCRAERKDNNSRFLMFNGKIKQVVEEAVRKEFEKEKTIVEIINRLVPLNIMQKIINKLANVYNEPPIRFTADQNTSDTQLMHDLSREMHLNMRQKEHNQYFKLFKCNLQEIVITDKGIPGVRNIPRQSYQAWSTSPTSPEVPDIICKFVVFDADPKASRYVWWTNTQHILTDGTGAILKDEMFRLNNPDGLNPYGTLPFVFNNLVSYSVNPIPDDDLLKFSTVIPLLLSDLTYAEKYLAWAVVYTIGVGEKQIPFSPNSVVALDFGPNGERPEIGTVKPQVDIPNALRLVEFLVATLLSTKDLSTSQIQGTLSADSAASGVAKLMDSAESMENKKDQQEYFRKAEIELWNKLAFKMMPVWREMGKLNPSINKEFSRGFSPNIIYKEPRAVISEKEIVEVEKAKVDAGLTTKKMALQRVHPDLDDKAIDILIVDIEEERNEQSAQNIKRLVGNTNPFIAESGDQDAEEENA